MAGLWDDEEGHIVQSHASLSVVAPTVRKAPLLRTSVAHFPFFS